MSIKKQKIICFIPFVNLLIIAIQSFLMYHRNVVPNKGKRIIRTLLIVAVACFIIVMVEVALDAIVDNANLETVINLLVSYACMCVFSLALVFDQEKYYKENQR